MMPISNLYIKNRASSHHLTNKTNTNCFSNEKSAILVLQLKLLSLFTTVGINCSFQDKKHKPFDSFEKTKRFGCDANNNTLCFLLWITCVNGMSKMNRKKVSHTFLVG